MAESNNYDDYVSSLPPHVILCKEIDEKYTNFINMETSVQKLQEKKLLECLAMDYLSIVPHKRKFYYAATSTILHETVFQLPNFTPYRMALAWEAISEFAQNLIVQPWRKEFNEIKIYSGFYTHQIANAMIRGERMLELMGYKQSDRDALVLDGPIDPDLVTRVSRDSFMAMVECQMIQSIFGDLIKHCVDLKFGDILQYRESNIGSPAQVVEQIISLLQHQNNQISLYNHYKCGHMPMPLAQLPQLQLTNNHQLPHHSQRGPVMGYNQYYAGYPPPVCVPVAHPNYPSPSPVQHMPHGVTLPNGYPQYGNSSNWSYQPSPVAASVSSVPTGQLIELESPNVKEPRFNSPSNCSNWTLKKTSSDYLEEARPIYQTPTDEFEEFYKTRKAILDGVAIGNTPVNRSSFFMDELMCERFKNMDISDPKESRIGQRKKSKQGKSGWTNSIRPDGKTSRSDPNPVMSSSTDWDCKFCTFHNKTNETVCEICSKSRVQGNEAEPLVSGGKQCPCCTYINTRDSVKCSVCRKGLEDSSTYV